MDSSNQSQRDLTDLEAVTIAYILRRAPCTPYAVRCAFEKSTTTRFSSSAGSIYPLIRRLHQRGLLAVTENASDGRGSKWYSVTSAGRREVRKWITGLHDPTLIGIYDPIRSRLLNLSLLPKAAQTKWLERMIELVERQKEVIRKYEQQEFVGDQRLYEISRDAAWQENSLRLSWLRRALTTIKEKPREK